jgi:hypothetical protein
MDPCEWHDLSEAVTDEGDHRVADHAAAAEARVKNRRLRRLRLPMTSRLPAAPEKWRITRSTWVVRPVASGDGARLSVTTEEAEPRERIQTECQWSLAATEMWWC